MRSLLQLLVLIFILNIISMKKACGWEDSDYWHGPTTITEFRKFHGITKEDTANLEEKNTEKTQVTICKYSEDGETYYCYDL